jgi:hypothetical protein
MPHIFSLWWHSPYYLLFILEIFFGHLFHSIAHNNNSD